MSKYILNLNFSPLLAERLGTEEAILLHFICFWVEFNKREQSTKHYKNGKYWVYYSDTKICLEVFSFLKPHQIKRMRKNLKEKGFIKTGCFNAFGPDKTTWYTYTDKIFEVVGIEYINKILQKNKTPHYSRDKIDQR